MKRKRVVRVLVYDGPVDWVDDTMNANFVKDVAFVGGSEIVEYVVSSVCYELAGPPVAGQKGAN